MTTHSKDLCPCGSGKRYKHCHQKKDEARRRTFLFGGLVAVLVAVLAAGFGPGLLAKIRKPAATTAKATAAADSAARAELAAKSGAIGTSAAQGAAAIGVVNPNGVAGPPLRDPGALTLTPPNSGALAPGEHPKDWEYDVAKNRYYDPREGHKHWHSGPPPVDPNAPQPMPNIIVTTPDGKPVQVTTSTTSK